MLPHEALKGIKSVVKCDTRQHEVHVSGKPQRFKFSRVYDQKTPQRTVYLEAVAPLVQRVVEGYQCTCFAYGPTGSGKTHTMEGPKSSF